MIGTSLGHYRIIDELGKGGMGEVYVAEDTKLHRQVALKILPAKFAKSASRRERFEREARAVAALDHPNIVTVFSVEEVDGVHFITMQLLEGEALSDRVPPNGLALDDFMDVAVALAGALAAAHAKGIIHRDLKPKNILITGDGTPKILDFGLAKLEQPAPAPEEVELDTLELTKPGEVLGTASYMSPEQLQGEAIDPRSDIFSLGVVLYQMATGRRPFRGRTAIAVASSILRDSPAPITDVRKELPRELARIVAACLEVSTDDRIQSAAELHSHLADLRQQLDSGVSLLTGLHKVTTGSRRRRMAVVTAALLGVLLIAAIVAIGWIGGREQPTGAREGPIRIAVLPLENLGPSGEEYFAAGITDEITTRLAGVSGLQVTSRTSALQFKGDRPSAREIGRLLNVDYLLVGTVRWAGLGGPDSQVRITPQLVRIADDSQMWAEPYTFPIDDIFQVQTQIAESVVSRLGTELLEPERDSLRATATDNIEAYKAYLEGLYLVRSLDYTLETWNRAVDSFERAVGLDPRFALAWSELAIAEASIHFLWLDLSDSRKLAARRAVARARELDPDGSATQLAVATYHYMIDRDYDLALHALALAEADRALEVEVLKTRGYVLRRQGSWPEAVEALERAFELDPIDATAAAEVAETYEVIRNHERALHFYERSIALDPEQTYSFHTAARANWTLLGSTAEARRLLERMPESEDVAPTLAWIWQEVYEGDYEAAVERLAASPLESLEYWDAFYPRSLLEAQIHELRQAPTAARSAFEQARAILETEVATHPRDPRRLSALGLAYAGLGQVDDAVRAGRRATELYPTSEDAYSGPTAEIELAMILTRVGELDAAIDLLEKLLAHPAVITRNLLELDPRWQPLHGHPRYSNLEDSYR